LPSWIRIHNADKKVTLLLLFRMLEEAERRQAEAERLRQEVMHAREAEKEAKNKLIGIFIM
jgi:hypothetical protein